MQPETCFNLHLVESDSTGMDLVLSTQDEDWSSWWPGKWGILEQFVKGDESQEWYYSEEDGSIRNGANPDYRLDEHQGWLYIANMKADKAKVDAHFPTSPRRWLFEDKTQMLTSKIGPIKVSAAIWGQPAQWAWAEVAPSELLDDKISSKWRIEYCSAH